MKGGHLPVEVAASSYPPIPLCAVEIGLAFFSEAQLAGTSRWVVVTAVKLGLSDDHACYAGVRCESGAL